MCQKESWGAIFATTEAHSTQRDQPPRMHGPGLWMYEQKSFLLFFSNVGSYAIYLFLNGKYQIQSTVRRFIGLKVIYLCLKRGASSAEYCARNARKYSTAEHSTMSKWRIFIEIHSCQPFRFWRNSSDF